jgi:acyl dehydratase
MPVEAGQVLRLRRALRLPEAVDVPPPTFVVVADHHDPGFERRPRPDHPWFGSGAVPTGVADDDPVHEGLFHVEHRIDHTRALVVGEVVTVHRRAPRTWTKQGRRGGLLTFLETTTELVAADGTEVVRSVWLDVATERSHAALTAGQPARETPRFEPPAGATAVPVVDDLLLTHVVEYVGAAGDLHPLHHDATYCRHRGLPGPFAPGMLTMGLTGAAIARHLGVEVLTTFGGRLLAQVWPGDALTAHLLDGDGHEEGAVTVTTVNQHGTPVFAGTATATPSPPPPA